jgi:uncharacterized protein DUF1524
MVLRPRLQLLLKGIGMVPRKTSLLVFTQIIFTLSISKAASPDYFTVHDVSQPRLQSQLQEESSLDPAAALSELADVTVKNMATSLDLMAWDHHLQTLEDPTIPYSRKDQYGSWIHDPRDSDCYNTRAKVLIRASSVPVSFSGAKGCTVKGGQWQDPYTDRSYTDTANLQIDHVVPLKNSYISGAWQWDGKKRCLYANFLSNDFHLLAVDGGENMKKGDRTPEGYMPPSKGFACEYLAIWLKIKLIWNLALTPSEATAISRLSQENHCDAGVLSMANKDLSQQRQAILANMDLCAGRK